MRLDFETKFWLIYFSLLVLLISIPYEEWGLIQKTLCC